MVQTGLDLTPIITHRFEYTNFVEGFELMRSGKSGKVILNWSDE
jgi:threonine 3-dehydrogenase